MTRLWACGNEGADGRISNPKKLDQCRAKLPNPDLLAEKFCTAVMC
jgi:hypothetical protein